MKRKTLYQIAERLCKSYRLLGDRDTYDVTKLDYRWACNGLGAETRARLTPVPGTKTPPTLRALDSRPLARTFFGRLRFGSQLLLSG